MRSAIGSRRFGFILSIGVIAGFAASKGRVTLQISRSLAVGLFLAAMMIFASPASAQTPEAIPLPSTIKAIDENGVDLISGLFFWPGLDQSIGTSESGMHLFQQHKSASDYFDVDNYSGYINFVTEGPANPVYHPDHMDVIYGGVTNRFQLVNGAWVPYKGGDGSFSCSADPCTYTDPQGTIIEFSRSLGSNGQVQYGRALRLIKPDGEIITFTGSGLGGGMLTASSSLGWMVKRVDTSSYRMINSAADYCDPAAANCDSLTSYPAFNNYSDIMANHWSITPVGPDTRPDGRPAFISKLTDPRGVETLFSQNNGGSGAPEVLSNRVWKVTRAGLTSTYLTYYLENPCCDGFAPLYPWRVVVNGSGGKFQLLEFSPDNSQAYLNVVDLGRATTESYLNYEVNSVTPPSGITTTYTRDSRNNITSATIRPQNGASNGSEDIVVARADYPTTCTNIKTCNKPIRVTDARNNSTAYDYDPNHGGVLTETKAAVNGIQAQTRFTYQQFTPYLKTSTGGTLAQPPVWRLVSTATCQTMTLATCAGTTDELKTTLSYDPSSSAYGASNLLPLSKTVSRGDGSLATTVTFTYDRFGNVIVEDGPRPGTDDAVYSFYDLKRHKIGTIGGDPDGSGSLPRAAVRTVYGADGQVESVAKGTVTDTTLAALMAMIPTERVDTEYSTTTGLAMVERHYATGASPVSVKQMSYDIRGRIECVALRMNPAAFSPLPTSACTPGQEGSDGPDRITKNVYNAGDLLQVRKAVGTSVEAADVTWSYTHAGEKDDVIDGNGNHAKFVYDKYNRLYQWQFPSTTKPSAFDDSTPANALASAGSVNTADYEQYGYDANGNRTSLRKRDGRSIAFSYDALNRVTSKCVTATTACVSPDAITGRDVYYDYDLMGHQLTARFDSASGVDGVTNAYNALGQLVSSTTAMAGTSRKVAYAYDTYGNMNLLKHPDQTRFQYGYDSLNRMATANIYGGAQFLSIVYDALGRRQSTIRGTSLAASTSYLYDSISRLDTETQTFSSGTKNTSSTFGYNLADQIKSQSRTNDAYAFIGNANATKSYDTNGLNQYSAVDGGALGYDANGNLTATSGTSLTYDAENRLVSAVGTLNASLVYDPMGRLFQTSVSGVSNSTTQFTYDGDKLIGEYDGVGNLLRRYLHGPGVDEPVMWAEGSGLTDLRFYHADHQGSIIATATAAGAPFETYTYDEYGVAGATNYANKGRFQYTGQTWIPELGMYYYKARIYSAKLGRFLQTDPIGYKDQMDLYAYVGNDVINRTDPTGTRIVYETGDAKVDAIVKQKIEDMASKGGIWKSEFDQMSKSPFTVSIGITSDVYKLGATTLGGNDNKNGKGTNVEVLLSLDTVDLGGVGVGGKGLKANFQDLAAHEFFDHAFKDMMGKLSGVFDLGLLDKWGTWDKAEVEAVGTENKWRTLMGEDLRERYNPAPDDPSKKIKH